VAGHLQVDNCCGQEASWKKTDASEHLGRSQQMGLSGVIVSLVLGILVIWFVFFAFRGGNEEKKQATPESFRTRLADWMFVITSMHSDTRCDAFRQEILQRERIKVGFWYVLQKDERTEFETLKRAQVLGSSAINADAASTDRKNPCVCAGFLLIAG